MQEFKYLFLRALAYLFFIVKKYVYVDLYIALRD